MVVRDKVFYGDGIPKVIAVVVVAEMLKSIDFEVNWTYLNKWQLEVWLEKKLTLTFIKGQIVVKSQNIF